MSLIYFNLSQEITKRVAACAASIEPFDEKFVPDIRLAEPRHGDFQANGVLLFAKRKQLDPRETANRLVQALQSSSVFPPEQVEIERAGPGFINFRFTASFLLQWLQTYRTAADIKTAAQRMKDTVVVDYSSPNTAKQMHVGHIRSMLIGEAISRLLAFCGAHVIRDNHIGDWGTQFGLLIMAIKREKYDLRQPHTDPLEDLERLYQQAVQWSKQEPMALETARQELVKLQNGDSENVALWEMINRISAQAFQSIYDLLDIGFDVVLGESFYRDKIDRVYQELTQAGIAEQSEGALVVFFPEQSRFKHQPFLIRKRDGASNYATTDLATVLYRCETFKAQDILYVTDKRQRDHFEQLFLTVKKWFQSYGYPLPTLRHISFGTILGENGKAIKTRSGDPIKLKDLLQEAIERAYRIVSDKNPAFPESERRTIARTVGIGAVRYADLMQSRSNDYVFSWGKLLSFEGNTAPYLLYAVARIYSIFRKLQLQPGEGEQGASPFETEMEWALARKQLGFVTALNQATRELSLHFLCTYLYELAVTFNAFYKQDKVNVSSDDMRARRLLLCARTVLFLEIGLSLLGIPVLKRM